VKNRFQAFAFKCNLYRYTSVTNFSLDMYLSMLHGGALHVGIKLTHNP
jgi:hypothetical protein